ncbi:MAG TPA: SusD/RagB family nutrient-binding outer membrane lipoprotein [Bacteroidales bacterium]|nr:SusD/RagB family nutrient-binding outer membrane lipoprotein [Bacteroidales bacterium]
MKRIKIFLLAAMLIGVAGCKDFLDINRDPNNPSEPNIRYMLPSIEATLGSIFTYDFGSVGYATAVFTHQLSSREPEYDNYGITGSAFVQNYWTTFYSGALQDLDLLINLGEDPVSQNLQYAGIGKVLKAYTFSTIVDLWGNVPFTEANQPGNLNPKYDTDKDIYGALFTMIDDGIADMLNDTAENLLTPGNDDLVYGGDVDKWYRMANTLKLKLYTQVKDVDDMYNHAVVDTLLANASTMLIRNWDESFMIPYAAQSSPDDRNPAFVTEYGGGQISNYISPWLFNIMSGKNDSILTGITDPRIPYYWVNQLGPDNSSPENDPEFRDGNFVSIYFGSVGINRDAAGRATFSMMGLYPCGGRYDDGAGLTSSMGDYFGTGEGTGAAPCRLLTYADRYYLEAELIVSNKTAQTDDRTALENAMKASFGQVNEVVSIAGLPAQQVPTISTADRNAYIDTVLVRHYDNATTEDQKMAVIMTQKWLSSFGTSHDQYTDYRRTGFPVMFDPENPDLTDTGIAGEMSGGPNGSGVVPVQQTRGYPLSWPYFNDEIQLNSNSPGQKANITTEGIFWDK